MKINYTLIFIFCFVTVLFSCKKDLKEDVVNPVNPPIDSSHVDSTLFNIPGISPVTGSITGIVVDENNYPVSNAQIVFSGINYFTDEKGWFHINNSTLDKYITTITVHKAGYFKGLRSFSATSSRNYVSIKLIPKVLIGTVSAVAGGTISLSNGTAITFQPNGLMLKGSGLVYNGNANVYAAYIDPTSPDIATKVPGSMIGQDVSHMFVLQSAGMIAVDLESPLGQPLQLVPGIKAAVKIPIPSSLTTKSPSVINTWSLSDRGVWIKEGDAIRNGDFYNAELSHFSFWNIDAPVNAIYLTLHIHDQFGHSLPNTYVQLSIPNNNTWWATTYGVTDSSGTVSGMVPLNFQLAMSLYPNIYNCGTAIATQNIGPFSNNTNMNITATLNTSQYVVIGGLAHDCNGQPLGNGLATIYTGQYSSYNTPVLNGSYMVSVPYCSNIQEATVIVTDNNGVFVTSSPLAISGNNVVVPTLNVCNTNTNALFNFVDAVFPGSFVAGVPINSGEKVMCVVNVQLPGHYEFPLSHKDGIYFGGSGDFTHTGLDTFYLPLSGTPQTTGVFSVVVISNNPASGNIVTWFGVSGIGGSAIFSLGGLGNCSNFSISGNYTPGIPLNPANTVTLSVNVTGTGSYYISTDSINGMVFAKGGVFTSTGTFAVVLNGSGTPIQAGVNLFTSQAYDAPGCTFNITTISAGSIAAFNFAGSPGTCQSFVTGGQYQTGVTLNNQNIVTLMVNVVSQGAYDINTDVTNGFSFSGSGVFSTSGMQTVQLFGSGTPITATSNSFTPSVANTVIQGCAFSVVSN